MYKWELNRHVTTHTILISRNKQLIERKRIGFIGSLKYKYNECVYLVILEQINVYMHEGFVNI